jgi:hypothetical protein
LESEIGRKDDQEKPEMDLLPPEFLEQTAQVLTIGAKRYGRFNWKHVERHRYIAALLRHICADMKDPGGADKDDGLPHMAHVAANAAIIIGLDALAKRNKKAP